MRAPAHHRRALAWLRGRGLAVERLRYPRPQAQGETAALRIAPRDAARMRVVVAHGGGNDAVYPLAGLFASLADAGAEVFTFDLDGNGWESTTRFSVETAPSALPQAIREASEGRDPLPLHVVGHSLGGALALHFMGSGAAEAEDVRSAVLVSAPLRLSLGARTAASELLRFFGPATVRECPVYGVWGVVPAVGPLKRRAFPFRHAGEDRALDYIAEVRRLLREMELGEAAGRVRAPVLLVYGGLDRLVPPEQGEELAGSLPDAALLRIDRGTHFSTVVAAEAIGRTVGWIVSRSGVVGRGR